jgi:hypothetical protein
MPRQQRSPIGGQTNFYTNNSGDLLSLPQPTVIRKCPRLVPNALVLTGLANFRVVGKPEILGLDLCGGQVVNALLYCVGLSETNPPPGPPGPLLPD